MFKKFWLDVILGTLFIFAIMFVISNMTAFKLFDIFDPIGEAFSDMEMTDVYFSKIQEAPSPDERIVLVNIADRSRFEIGMMLDSINQHDPAVIGMDTFFSLPHDADSIGDAVLSSALARVENLVMASKLEVVDENDPSMDYLAYSWPLFMPEGVNTALVNLATGAASQEDLKMCREFAVNETVDGIDEWAFGVKLATFLEPEKAQKFVERGRDTEVVNYRGNIIDYGATDFGNMFSALDDIDVLGGFNPTHGYEVIAPNYIPSLITGKIVIFCYLGSELGDRESLEDHFFTPINSKYIGRAFPDMYGGVIHANIAAMILNEDYINQLTSAQAILIAILICFLNVTLFSYIYKKIPKWYDGVTKLIQLIEFFGLVFVMIWVLDTYSLKLDLTISLFVVALVGDTLEVYYGLVKNSLTRSGRKELFRVSKI